VEHRSVPEKPRTEDHIVFIVLAVPVFVVTILIIVVILLLSPLPR
jgi:hypothetical protein